MSMPARFMKTGWAALLLLSACGPQSPGGVVASDTNESEIDPAMAANLIAEVRPEDPAELKARVDSAMAAILRDPKSARYANIRGGAGGAVCGEVDIKQANGRYGGFRPFLVAPDGTALVSRDRRVSFADPDDRFPDAWINLCASPEELRTLGPGLRGVPVAPLPAGPPDLPDPGPDPGDVPATPPGPPAAVPPSGAAPEPQQPGRDETFFNAVVKPKLSGK
jgi:hypothetical protein